MLGKFLIFLNIPGNPHSPFSLGPETPPPAYSPHDDGGGIDRPPAPSSAGSIPPGQNMETDNTTLSEAVPYQVILKKFRCKATL